MLLSNRRASLCISLLAMLSLSCVGAAVDDQSPSDSADGIEQTFSVCSGVAIVCAESEVRQHLARRVVGTLSSDAPIDVEVRSQPWARSNVGWRYLPQDNADLEDTFAMLVRISR